MSVHVFKTRATVFQQQQTLLEPTRPCVQVNWDTWIVLDPWDQV